jgi:CheY-like chemotaxis protein
VVDDNEYNLKVAHGLLELFEIDAQTVSSGRQAIEMIKNKNFDIVFMDHMMPEMDGLETTAAVRNLGEKYRQLAIIALTANAVQGAREMFLKHGFNDFITKPIEMHELLNILIKWLPFEKVVMNVKKQANMAENKESSDGFWEALSKITDVDTEIGLQRVNGLKDMYRDSLKLFHEKLMADNEKLIMFMENGDFSNFSISVHAIKSMLASVGAQELSDMAFGLEKASKGGDFEYCKTKFPPFSGKVASLHKQLQALFPPEEITAEKEKGSAAYLKENLQKALEAVENFDTDGCTLALNKILEYDFGEEINMLLEDAVKMIKQYQYDEAKEILLKVLP